MQSVGWERTLGSAQASTPEVSERNAAPKSAARLTPREIEVLRNLAHGYKNVEIAQRMGIAPRTVAVHMSNVMQKLRVRNRTEALLYAARAGYVHQFGGDDSSTVLCNGCRQMETFTMTVGDIASEADSTDALRRLVDTARDVLQASYSSLAVWDAQGDLFSWVGSGFPTEDPTQDDERPLSRFVPGLPTNVDTGTARDVRNGYLPAPDAPHRLPSFHSFISSPLNMKNDLSGAIYVMNKENSLEFTPEDQRTLNHVGLVAGTLVENLRLENEVIQERAALSAVRAGTSDGLMIVGADNRVSFCSAAAASLLGVSTESLEGELVDEAFRGMTDEAEENDLLGAIHAAVHGPVTFNLAVSSPQTRDLSVTVDPISISSTPGMTGITLRDVTAQREAERWRDVFISVTSHELRTPASIIVGFSELLQNEDLMNPVQREWIERILISGQRLTAILDQMLTLTQINMGKLTVAREPLSVCAIVNDAIAANEDASKSHEFVLDIPDDCPEAVGDHGRAVQALTNIVSNAVKFSPDGGKITISASANPDSDDITIVVFDEGVGIPQEDLDAIFTAFYRVSQLEIANARGAGLGLAIARELAHLLGGNIRADSVLGKGSTFHFSLPGRASVLIS